jgi:DNA-binding NtrC family response regulator
MGKRRILLVDDEPDFLDIMGERIGSWGYDVIKASDGKEAIASIKRQRPDAVVLDYLMPKMDGIVTLGKIREVDSELPVIIFTAHPDTKSLSSINTLKVSAFIPKLTAYGDIQSSLKTALDMIERNLSKETEG